MALRTQVVEVFCFMNYAIAYETSPISIWSWHAPEPGFGEMTDGNLLQGAALVFLGSFLFTSSVGFSFSVGCFGRVYQWEGGEKRQPFFECRPGGGC